MLPNLGSNVRNDGCLPDLFFSSYRPVSANIFTFFLFVISNYLIRGVNTRFSAFPLNKKAAPFTGGGLVY